MKECKICDAVEMYMNRGFSKEEAQRLAVEQFNRIEIHSKNLSEWIAHCIRKHVKGDEKPKMTRDQCIAAGHKKFGVSKKK